MTAGRHVLVSCDWLAHRLNDPAIRVIEVSSLPSDETYRAGHIPGAVLWYWKDALWHETDREFPLPEEMARRLGSIGVGPDTTVVLYGDPVQFGVYAFWVLTMGGHPDVRMLDGGRKRWTADGRPLSQEVPSVTPVSYPAQVGDSSSRVGRDDVRAGLGRSDRLLLDVRTPEEYAGQWVGISADANHGAERAGRIPGAVHLYFREFLNEDDTFKHSWDLRQLCSRVGIPLRGDGAVDKETVAYCRLSHRASLAWFALRYLLGQEKVRIYDGSWTEWGSIVGFPVER
jgi:thiosulfate/3-mercaptopyruvate sulfurtransferase